MRSVGRVGLAVLSACAAGCPGGGVQTPAPVQPKLEGVRLVGGQVCAPFTTGGSTFTFTCPGLPTIESTGWQLTPLWVPSTSNPQRQRVNRTVVLTVSGPSLTEVDVELQRAGGGANFPLTAVDANLPGRPREVGATKEVGVRATDDGTRKTWQIDVNVSTCAEFRTLSILNRSSASPSRSNPLTVTLLRSSDETSCALPGGGPFLAYSTAGSKGAGPGDPVNAPPGPCAGGASERLFHVCENCANLHPPELNVYSAGDYCSWQDVLAVYGYSGPATTKPQLCTIRQVQRREECEGPP
jgi:hypothetical protein